MTAVAIAHPGVLRSDVECLARSITGYQIKCLPCEVIDRVRDSLRVGHASCVVERSQQRPPIRESLQIERCVQAQVVDFELAGSRIATGLKRTETLAEVGRAA